MSRRIPLIKTLSASVLAVTLGAALSTSVVAHGGDGPGQGKGQSKGKGGDRGHKMKDPEVRAEKMFDRLDADGSGVITIDEFLSRPQSKADRHFDRLDTDQNSSLSLEEFLDRPGRGHRGLDRDAIRTCVEEETGEDLPERPEPEAVFATMDANGDEAVSQDEFLAAAESRSSNRFQHLDADNDGGITLDEMKAGLADRAGHRDIRRQCAEEQRAADDLTGG